MTRYLYSMGREHILPAAFGKTHPRYKSPYIASLVQSAFTLVVLIFLGLIIQQSNKDGSVSYALGIADGKVFQQTNGISSYGWLAIIGTICFIIVYIMTNLAAPIYARSRGEFSIFTHVVAPIISTLALLIPLAAFVLPPLPGIGTAITGLGFAPTPFPLNILPVFVLIWLAIGFGISFYLARVNPERYRALGHIVSGADTEETVEAVPLATAASDVRSEPVAEVDAPVTRDPIS
jgi:amino acid transporter